MSKRKYRLPKVLPVVPFPEPIDAHREPGDRTCRICGGTGLHDWNFRTKDYRCMACNGTGKGKICEDCGEVMPMCACVRKYSAMNMAKHEAAKEAKAAK